ncbi:MAG: hypothetical protein KDE00_14575 [Rhodobacteraceae bacterium]|nr:hypothetical protein [Paracoccaceae bacterium]
MLQIPADQSAPREPLILVEPGVYHERRDRRMHLDVRLPFSVYVDGKALKGAHFNIGSVAALREGYDGWSGEPIAVGPDAFPSGELTIGLHIQLSGFALDLDLVGVPEAGRGEDEGLVLFRIVRMDPDSRDALKRIIRAYQAGHVPTSEDFVASLNPETRDGASANGIGAPAPRSWANRAAIAVSGMAILGIAGISAVSLYDRFFVVRSEFAAITAPQLTLLSPAQGQVEVTAGPVGSEVVLDQPLYRIEAPALESEIGMTEARIEALQAPAAAGAPGADQLSLETAQLKALDLRRQGLSQHSACDCTVVWSVENQSWVKEGDQVMILARTGADDLRIEAVVKLAAIDGLEAGQPAGFRAPGSGAFLPAMIERITLDANRQPRYGFPDWIRKEPTVASVILRADAPVEASWIGQPIEVLFNRRAAAQIAGE